MPRGLSIALTGALKTNQTLTTLNLDGNHIGDEGAVALAEALKANQTPTTLHLIGDGHWTKVIMGAIRTTLEKNKSLREAWSRGEHTLQLERTTLAWSREVPVEVVRLCGDYVCGTLNPPPRRRHPSA